MEMIRRWMGKRGAVTLAPDEAGMREEVKGLARKVKGFLSEREGMKLFELARAASAEAPCLEIGGYCGKSTMYLAEGCRAAGSHCLFSIDHHHGSEEQQPGQEYFDPELFDAARGVVDTLPAFLDNVRRAGLRDWVIPVVAESLRLGANWRNVELGLVFIDGGHARQDVETDFQAWGGRIVPGGWLCFHDVYPNPADGGQAPYEVFETVRRMRQWRSAGLFESLGVLQRR